MSEFDPKSVKLGKKAAKIDKRTLRLADYFLPSLPAPPASVDWTAGLTSFGMMLNDNLGDCTCAAVGHAIQIWSANVAGLIIQTISDETVLKLYEQSCGYNPADPNSDQGGVEVDVLNFWRKNPQETHRLLAYADPDPGNIEHIKTSIALFGGVYIGLQLPITASNQVGSTWAIVGNPEHDPESMPGSWGGHAVYVCGYTPSELTCITWGRQQKMTWDFWRAYCDESHTLLGGWWITHRTTPSGFNHKELNEDLLKVTN